MKIIDKYIIRVFLWNYGIALLVMTALYVIVHLYLNLDEFIERRQPAAQVAANIASFYGYNLFLYFSQLAGLITIVAAAATLAKLQRSNEIVVLLASGTSLYRVLAPVLVMGLLMNALWIANQELMIPRIADKLVRLPQDVEGTNSYPIWFVPDGGRDRLLSAMKYFPGERQMQRMLLIRRGPDGSLQEILTADQARWNPQTRVWDLARGGRMTAPAADAQQNQIERTGVESYASRLTPEELMVRQATQWADFLSLRQITQFQNAKIGPPLKLAKIKHSRVTTPIMNIVMLVIGIYGFLHKMPRPVIKDASLSLLMSGLTFATTFVAMHLINVEELGSLPAWLPVIVFGPVAVILLDSVRS